MTDIALYQSVLQKLGQLAPQDLSVLDAFLTSLVSKEKQTMPSIKTKQASPPVQSPVYWLEQLAKINALAEIKDPVEWQREIRKDRKLSR